MSCNVYSTVKKTGLSKRRLEHIVAHALRSLHDDAVDISVHVVGEKKMKRLNTQYRGIDAPTDVLSFEIGTDVPHVGEQDGGDIFICPSYLRKQARRFAVPFEEEYARMLIHGVLHLRGYDHVRPKDATRMFAQQESILSSFLSL